MGSKKPGSSTVRRARSASSDTWSTRAATRSESPYRRTWMKVASLTTCAFVRMRWPAITNPEPETEREEPAFQGVP